MRAAEPKTGPLADVALALLLLGFAWLVRTDAAQAPPSWFPGDIGVNAVPELANAALAVLASMLLIRALFGLARGERPAIDTAALIRRFREGGYRPLLTGLLLFGFITLLGYDRVPFEVLAFAYVAANLWLLRGRGWNKVLLAVGVALATVAAISLVFTQLFTVVLP